MRPGGCSGRRARTAPRRAGGAGRPPPLTPLPFLPAAGPGGPRRPPGRPGAAAAARRPAAAGALRAQPRQRLPPARAPARRRALLRQLHAAGAAGELPAARPARRLPHQAAAGRLRRRGRRLRHRAAPLLPEAVPQPPGQVLQHQLAHQHRRLLSGTVAVPHPSDLPAHRPV